MTYPLRADAETTPRSEDARALSLDTWAIFTEGIRFLALRALGDPDAANDVAQETVLRAWRASAGRQGEQIREPAAFVYGIARHVIADARRARGQTVTLDVAASTPAPERDALDALISEEERARVRAAIRALPRADRVLLELSYLKGMTSAAIAARLGEPPTSIRKRKSRALQRLRAAFSGG